MLTPREHAARRDANNRLAARRLRDGLCVACGGQLATTRYCDGCNIIRANYQRTYRQRPDVKQKRVARESVRKALKCGALVKPPTCDRCHRPRRLNAHHESYEPSQRRVVEWLCSTCDGVQHRKHKAA